MSDERRGDRGLDESSARLGAGPSRSGGDPPSSSPLAADVFDAMPVGVALFGADGRLRHANPVFTDLLGTALDALRGRTLGELVEDAERDLVEERLEEVVTGQANAFECLLAASPPVLSGLSWTIRAHVAPAFGSDGGIDGMVLQVFDFGPAGAPPPLPAGLAEVLEEGSDFLLTAGPDGHLSYGNRSAREVLGVRLVDGAAHLEDVLETGSLEFYREIVEPQVFAYGSWQGELTFRTRQGRAVPVSARIVAHGPTGSVEVGPTVPRSVSLFARDITELKTAERKLRQLATHDYLTGLPNRLLLYDRLDLALNRYARYGTPVALMFCDLDGFKPVNDRYGHQVGDGVLTEVADRIHSAVRDTDTAARLGGDEFGVLVEGVDDLEMLVVVAERMIAAIAEPIRVNGSTVQVGVSIGIAIASADFHETDALVAAADAAMYRAKAEGRGRFMMWNPESEDPDGGLDSVPSRP
jgi:diguanylate cyclase (GGDEF)-like protein/PAS domain S-box-containing protein